MASVNVGGAQQEIMSATNLVVQSFLWLVLVCACVVLGTREQQLPLLKTTATSHYDLGTKIVRFQSTIVTTVAMCVCVCTYVGLEAGSVPCLAAAQTA